MPRSTEALVGDLTEESQLYGDTVLRLAEFSRSGPLSAPQVSLLREAREQLSPLALELESDLDGDVRLRASGVVGVARVVDGRDSLLIQVEPKIPGADVFRMLDTVYGLPGLDTPPIEMPTAPGWPAILFVRFFLSQAHAFLKASRFRGYHYAEQAVPARVKGRPLIGPYVDRHLARCEPQTVPCRYVDFSVDIFENQVIAYALHATAGLLDVLEGAHRDELLGRLRECTRLLAGVEIKRVEPRDIDAHRYTRLTEDFKPLHRICRAIIANYRTSFQPGARVPFTAFGVNMGQLFESYVMTCFARAMPDCVEKSKSALTYLVPPFGKEIELDGLLSNGLATAVIECKYKDISQKALSEADGWVAGKVRSSDLYQTIAYAGHSEVSANVALLAYPSWARNEQAVELSAPTRAFGWYPGAVGAVECYLVGINLSADQVTVCSAIESVVASLPGFSRT